MLEVMSVILKTNLNSNSVPAGGDGFGKAGRLNGFHTSIASHVALQLSVAAEYLEMPASVSDTYYLKQEALCIFPLGFSLLSILNCSVFM